MNIKYSFLSLVFIFSLQSQAMLWKSEQTWSTDWEKKYTEWLQKNVNSSFFQKIELATDCADAVLATRWIFARINYLPMASTSSNGTLLSNLSTSWDGLPTVGDWSQDQRFLKALKNIIDNTSSKTLFQDLYPVQLTTKSLVVGTVFINATQESGHVEWISETQFDALHSPITFYSSTVPQQVRELLVYPLMKIKWPEKNKNGFMRFRWPILENNKILLRASNLMSDYSLEQYELSERNDYDFDDFIAMRLLGYTLDGLQKLQIQVSHLSERIENRILVVTEGAKACGQNQCTNTQSLVFYNYSTYSRDGEILLILQGIQELIYGNQKSRNSDDQLAGQMAVWWSQFQTKITFEILGRTLALGNIVLIWNQNLFSSDPNLSVQQRWGLSN